MLAFGLNDDDIGVIDSKTFKVLYILNSYRIISICFSPDNKYLASKSCNGTIKIWDCDNNFQEITTIFEKHHYSRPNSMCFSPDSKYLASKCLNCIIKIFDCINNYNILNIVYYAYGKSICFSPCSTKILYGDKNNNIK